MNKLHKNRRHDDACPRYHTRKFRRRWAVALAFIARNA
jgi:hypothetical protein